MELLIRQWTTSSRSSSGREYSVSFLRGYGTSVLRDRTKECILQRFRFFLFARSETILENGSIPVL